MKVLVENIQRRAPWASWVVVFVVLASVLRFGVASPGSLPAVEVDAIEAGVNLAAALAADRPPRGLTRVGAGFEPHEGNPRVALYRGKKYADSRAVVEPPIPKWAVAGAMSLPSSARASNWARASTGAALLVALALCLLAGGFWRRDRRVAALAAVLLLATPGLADAAVSAGAAATVVALMALLTVLMAVSRTRPAALWGVGVVWGLLVGCHPAALLLIVPVFVAYLVMSPSEDDETSARSGMLRLPTVPVALLATPVVGLVTLLLAWPALSEHGAERLGAWLVDAWWVDAAPYDVAGITYDPAVGRAGPAWAALAQWASWVAAPVVVAFGLGVVRIARSGRGALWFPLLCWITVVAVGSADGTLFGARLTLMPFLWVPTALIAAVGVLEIGALLTAGPLAGLTLRRSQAIAALVVVIIPLVSFATRTGSQGAGGAASHRRALPLSVLQHIATTDPWAFVHVGPDSERWRPAVDAARDHLELPIRWGERQRADWVVIAGAVADGPGDGLDGLTPAWDRVSGGLRFRAYRVDASRLGRRAARALDGKGGQHAKSRPR